MSRVVEIATARGEFLTGDDGFVAWWPGSIAGYVTADNLRELADELDRKNADWNKQITEYFSNHAPSEETGF